MYASLRGYISVWVGRNQNGQTDKRGQRKSIRRRRQTLIRKRSGSSIAVRWQRGEGETRTKDSGPPGGGNVLATGQQQLAIRRAREQDDRPRQTLFNLIQ